MKRVLVIALGLLFVVLTLQATHTITGLPSNITFDVTVDVSFGNPAGFVI